MNNLSKTLNKSCTDRFESAMRAMSFVTEHGPAFLSVLEPIKDKIFDVSVDGGGFNVTITGTKADLTAVFRAFAACGFFTSSTRPTPDSTSWYGFFHKEGSGFSIFLSFSSTVCKRVQVGTQMVEQPVYEIQCGESE